jgi:hypothetical protein
MSVRLAVGAVSANVVVAMIVLLVRCHPSGSGPATSVADAQAAPAYGTAACSIGTREGSIAPADARTRIADDQDAQQWVELPGVVGQPNHSSTIHPPTLRDGAITTHGRLPPEAIQKVVRRNFQRLRVCYEDGLRINPMLQGRVTVKFVIDRTGAVAAVSEGEGDLPDRIAVGCILGAFLDLSFPRPEAGIVTVLYPIHFSPGG